LPPWVDERVDVRLAETIRLHSSLDKLRPPWCDGFVPSTREEFFMPTYGSFLTVASGVAAAAILSLSGSAFAVVTQPNGTVIPINGGPSLSGYINGSPGNDNINEGIDVVQEAATEPQKFSPLCDFGGKYVAKGGGANFAVGWYNVDDNRPNAMPPLYVPVDLGAGLNMAAPNSDIQILFPFSSSLPPAGQQTLDAVSIRQNPMYKGGSIGFVLVPNPNGTGNGNATQYHYTEHRFNTLCSQCATPGPWYSDLIYKSKMLPNTFYLGFEDLDFLNLPGDQGVNGNDLDYEDFLFRFTGIACAVAGQPCDVPGGLGICQRGVTDCDGSGNPICKTSVAPGSQMEACDALDNDCNGLIDDNAMCPPKQVCYQGACVESCASGEFPCPPMYICQGDVCIEEACKGVVCNAGEVCSGGVCRAACAGVVCPLGQTCSGDKCVDDCAGVACAMGQVCVHGVCIASCACRPCGSGDACDMATGECVEAGCVGMNCVAGTVCKGGACVDACMGVTCPPGQNCEMGQCVTPPPMMTTSSSSGEFVGSGGNGPSSSSGSGGAGGNAMGGMGGAGTGASGPRPGTPSSCGCRIDSAMSNESGIALVAGIAALVIARRRRKGE